MNMLQRFPATPPSDNDFDWFDDRDAFIVIAEQLPIAVYFNPNGDVVIRQKDGNGEKTDSLIVVQPSFAAALVRAIIGTAKDAAPDSEPRDTTAASREPSQ